MPKNYGSPADIDALLHPARAFKHPIDVVRDDHLTLYEKRAILSSWASDACAVEDFPELRQLSATGQVKFDDIMGALRGLDSELERRVHRDQNTVQERLIRRDKTHSPRRDLSPP
jgi:hypothetical protein